MITTFLRTTEKDENEGPGYAWLVLNQNIGLLEVKITKYNDMISDFYPEDIPLLNIDLFEHAYYFDYENCREKYLKEIWKIINWKKVAERFEKAVK